jgi:hypothetical protein
MELFAKLFGASLVFEYHCFDHVVLSGYLKGLQRPGQIVYWPASAGRRSHHHRGCQQPYRGLCALGGEFRPQALHRDPLARRGCPHGGLRPLLPAAHGA